MARRKGPRRPCLAGAARATMHPMAEIDGNRVPLRARVIRTILLATDLGPTSAQATEHAISIAAQLHARLLLVNVLDTRRVLRSGRNGRVDQLTAEREPLLVDIVQRARSVGVATEFLLWTGDPGEAILSAVEAEGADLIVVGSHGRDGASRLLLGSISDHLVRNAACPVLVVRPTDQGRAPAAA
jgi:nucleotide-binding universal stress UspA family protein